MLGTCNAEHAIQSCVYTSINYLRCWVMRSCPIYPWFLFSSDASNLQLDVNFRNELRDLGFGLDNYDYYQ